MFLSDHALSEVEGLLEQQDEGGKVSISHRFLECLLNEVHWGRDSRQAEEREWEAINRARTEDTPPAWALRVAERVITVDDSDLEDTQLSVMGEWFTYSEDDTPEAFAKDWKAKQYQLAWLIVEIDHAARTAEGTKPTDATSPRVHILAQAAYEVVTLPTSDTITIRGATTLFETIAVGERIIIEGDLSFTYLVEHTLPVVGKPQTDMLCRRGKPIINPAPILARLAQNA